MNQTIKELLERKSVRAYLNQPIEKDIKEIILNCALQAPTAGNMTLYSIIDITKQDIKDKLAVLCDNQPFIASAPMVLVFVADYQKWYDSFTINHPDTHHPEAGDMVLAISDTLIAAQNTVVAAQSLGIGSCYIGDIIENHDDVKELLSLPKYTMPVAMVCYGYPQLSQVNRKKPQRFNIEDILFENTYQKMNDKQLLEMFNKKNDNKGIDMIERIYNRKWEAKFTYEMTRSVLQYFEEYK